MSLFFVFLASLAVTYLVRFIPIIDRPDEARRLHTRPIPRTGGIAMFSVFAASIVVIFWLKPYAIADNTRILLFLAGSGFVIGLVDDVVSLSARFKFTALLVLSLIASILTPVEVVYLPILGQVDLPFYASIIGVGLWIFTFTNIANFMDGANGLAYSCMSVMALTLGILQLAKWQEADPNLAFPLFFVFAGFLVWNIRGVIFSGDAGTLAFGALIAGLGLNISHDFGIWCIGTIVLPFLVDALLTMAKRARSGANIFASHNAHLYQRLVQNGWSHLDVTWLYAGLTCLCCLAAVIAALFGDHASFYTFWGLVIILSWGWVQMHRIQA